MKIHHSGDINEDFCVISEARCEDGFYSTDVVNSNIKYKYMTMDSEYICRVDYKYICKLNMYRYTFFRNSKVEVRSDRYGLWIKQEN